jgi:hypothetical protein
MLKGFVSAQAVATPLKPDWSILAEFLLLL